MERGGKVGLTILLGWAKRSVPINTTLKHDGHGAAFAHPTRLTCAVNNKRL